MKKEQQRVELSKALGNIDDKFLMEDFTSMTKKKKISKTLLIMAATIGVLTAGTYYTGLLPHVVEQFSNIWGGSSFQTEMIQHIGYPVEASATSEGVTITVDAVMGDESTATVIYSIGNEDGTPYLIPDDVPLDRMYLYEGEYFSSGVNFDNNSSYGSISYFRDYDPDDGTIQFVEIISSEGKIPKNTVCTAYFGEIGYWNNDYTEQTTLLSGDWSIDFRFKYTDISEKFTKNTEIVWENETIDITSVSISPFSVRVDFTFDNEATGDELWNVELLEEQRQLQEKLGNLSENQEEQREELENLLFELDTTIFGNNLFYYRVPYFVTLVDGTVIDCDFSGGGHRGNPNKDYNTGYITFMFEEMLDMNNIQSITYGDYTVEVNP